MLQSTSNNFFFKIKSFCKNFDKYTTPEHPQNGHYINLDFIYLVELSKLDMYLRTFILQTSLDIEHCLKVHLNKDFMHRDLDGYSQVSDFFDYMKNRIVEEQVKNFKADRYAELIPSLEPITSFLFLEIKCPDKCNSLKIIENSNSLHEVALSLTQGKDLHYIENSISRMSSSTYSRKLIKKYGEKKDMAIWNYLEMVSFGDCIAFYKFYFLDYLKDKKDTEEVMAAHYVKPLLFPVKTLRNAAAHNDCLLNGLRERLQKPIGSIAKNLEAEYGLDDYLLSQTKRVPVLHDFSALLLCYNKIVESPGIRKARSSDLDNLQLRFQRNVEYFDKQEEVKRALDFFETLFSTFSEALSHPVH